MVSSEEIKKRLEAKRRGIESQSKGKESSLEEEMCPHCETMNPPEAKFCVGCGKTLKEEITPTVTSKTEEKESSETSVSPRTDPLTSNQAEYKICPACKQKNKLEAKFCVICGNSVESVDGYDKSESPSELLTSKEDSETLPDTLPKSELAVTLSEMEDKKNESDVPSVPTSNTGKYVDRSENVDPVEKIRKAKELLDMGAITKEEFEQIKNKYLKQI
jgi:ribosomal protein L40E